ncbi:MAG TPA: SMP-30/gluconolactonase/LRE family protein [Amphiplicatus sp.]|nr:SMP-30/gluconolactonase/LRE family protein [Amphiplicatus sp.]
MQRVLIVFAAALAALVAYFLATMIPLSGAFAHLENRLVDQCDSITVAPGTEDVTIDPDTNLAFITAADRRGWYNKSGEEGAAPSNGVYAMTVSSPHEVRLVSPPMDDFLPHGESLWRGPNGEKRLFVINHPTKGGQYVEIFDVGEGGMLTHVESVSFPEMEHPNDVLAVGPRQFYITNDHKFDKGPLAVLEPYLALPFASVAYFDGEKGRIVRKNIAYANGINQSPDGKHVYVSELLKRRILVFDRNAETGDLTPIGKIKVNTAPDNIEVSRDGALWVAGHSRIFDFVKHAKDPNVIAPSHVVRINARSGENKDLFIDTTGKLNASSVGAVWDKTLIVGAVFDDHVMVCPMVEIFLRGPGASR